MIYQFPTLDALHLAITSGVVPTEVSLTAAKGGLDDDGHIWLEPSVPLSRKIQTALRRIGVEILRTSGQPEGEELSCWLQLLPLARASGAVPTAQVPVLFELADAAQLPVLVGEMLRLGNDRQGLRCVCDDSGSRVLLRVIGPPFFTLLRALESDGPVAAARAYVEQAPRVWVEYGYTHPLVDKIRPKEGRFLLMRPPRDWKMAEDAAFQDVYDILDFQLPEGRINWRDAELESRIRVPLRLARAGTAEAPDLWVVRDQAIEQLDTLVRDADDLKLQQLAFAVAEHDGRTEIVLRVRPSKQAPPELAGIQGDSYRSYKRLPNLFLPHGTRLQPPLRRDAVRKLLAHDPDQITWLVAQSDSSFRPESLPETAFRPLRDWVEYVLDRDQQALTAWMQAARFDFESFVCKDDQRPTAPKPPSERKRPAKVPEQPTESAPPAPSAAKPQARPAAPTEFSTELSTKPGEAQQRRAALEKQFLEVDGPLDAPERQALWPEMAALNALTGQPADAALCWQHALWENDAPPTAWTDQWLHTEAPGSAGAALDRLLAGSDPPPPEVRAVAACIIACPDAVKPRLARVRRYLEQYESRLGIRAAWLAWMGLTRLSHGDVLGLARARDRLLDRLLASGLNMENDLPSFLRFSGHQGSDHLRNVRQHLLELREMAHEFIRRSYAEHLHQRPYEFLPKGGPPHDRSTSFPKIGPHVSKLTAAYCDLTFAFGLARLGEESECARLEQAAGAVLDDGDSIQSYLLRAYGYRISQAIKRAPHGGPLTEELIERLESLEKVDKLLRYRIDHLRRSSRLLAPHEILDEHRIYTWAVEDEVGRNLSLLATVRDQVELRRLADEYLTREDSFNATAYQRASRLAILFLVLPLGEDLTVKAVDSALDAIEPFADSLGSGESLKAIVPLLERGLFMAAHYGRGDRVKAYLGWFLRLFAAQLKAERGTVTELDRVFANSFHGLRKLGLRDEISRLLHQIAERILQGQDLSAVRARTDPTGNWSPTVRTLLHIAGAWLYFGRVDDALPILDAARELLFSGSVQYYEKNRLALAYAAALGQAPVEFALVKFRELFTRIGSISDSQLTGDCFSLSQLQLIETVVLAMVSDDFVLGQNARRWLDEDEYLVRRRIHRDLRAVLAQSGM